MKLKHYIVRFEDRDDEDAPRVSFRVEAGDREQAIERAYLRLEADGYDTRDYALTRVSMTGANQ